MDLSPPGKNIIKATPSVEILPLGGSLRRRGTSLYSQSRKRKKKKEIFKKFVLIVGMR
jgi:hypothetical protein